MSTTKSKLLRAAVAAAALGIVAAADPAGALPTAYQYDRWATSGVAGVSADGFWEYDTSKPRNCTVAGFIDDTKGDGHAAGVQIQVTSATFGGPPEGFWRFYNHNGANGPDEYFDWERNVTGDSRVYIREFISEQGDILDSGPWVTTNCNGLV